MLGALRRSPEFFYRELLLGEKEQSSDCGRSSSGHNAVALSANAVCPAIYREALLGRMS